MFILTCRVFREAFIQAERHHGRGGIRRAVGIEVTMTKVIHGGGIRLQLVEMKRAEGRLWLEGSTKRVPR